jgi:hypothetical protein
LRIAQVGAVGIGHRVQRPAGQSAADVDQTVGIGDAGQRTNQQCVGDAEDGGGAADADGERQHGDNREAGTLDQRADAAAEIGRHG